MCSAINGVCNYFLSSKKNGEQNEHALGFDQNAVDKEEEKLSEKTERRGSGAGENPKAVTTLCKAAHFPSCCQSPV